MFFKRPKINKKRPGLAHFFKKVKCFTLLATCRNGMKVEKQSIVEFTASALLLEMSARL